MMTRLHRWTRGLAWGAAVGLATLAVWFVPMLYRWHVAEVRLAAALAELDRDEPGWTLADMEATRAAVPDAENSAPVIREAANALTADHVWDWPKGRLETWSLGDHAPNRRITPDWLREMREALDAAAGAVPLAQKVADFPRGRHPIHYQPQVYETLLKHVDQVRALTALLEFDALIDLDGGGEPSRAVRDTLAVLNLQRSLGDEPLGITQLVRMGLLRRAVLLAERLVASSVPDATQVEWLRAEFARETMGPLVTTALRGERAGSDHLFRAIEGRALPPRDWWTDYTLSRHVTTEHVWMLERMRLALDILDRPMSEWDAAGGEWAATSEAARGMHVAKLTAPAVRRYLNVSVRVQVALDTAIAALAVERYRLANARWPASLDEVGGQPPDRYTDAPLLYRRLPDGAVVYSVGPDRQDDGGTLDRGPEPPPGTDLGFRLFDPAARRRPPPAE